MGRFSTAKTEVKDEVQEASAPPPDAPDSASDEQAPDIQQDSQLTKPRFLDAKVRLHRTLIEAIDLSALERVSPEEVRDLVGAVVRGACAR